MSQGSPTQARTLTSFLQEFLVAIGAEEMKCAREELDRQVERDHCMHQRSESRIPK